MDVIKTNLASLFSGDDTNYTIPVYQRKYSWKPKQCRQLFDDLLSIIRTDREHFFGSVVLCHDKHTLSNEWKHKLGGEQAAEHINVSSG